MISSNEVSTRVFCNKRTDANSWKGLMDAEKIPFGGWSTALISIPSAVIGGFFGGTIGLYAEQITYANIMGSFLCGVCCSGGLGILFLWICVVFYFDYFEFKWQRLALYFLSIVLAGATSGSISGFLNLAIADETGTFSSSAFFLVPLFVSIPISLIVIRVMHLLFMKSTDSQKQL